MPIYEFECQTCHRESEVIVRSADWHGTECVHCGSTDLEKKLSVFASTAGSDDATSPCSGNPSACGRCQIN